MGNVANAYQNGIPATGGTFTGAVTVAGTLTTQNGINNSGANVALTGLTGLNSSGNVDVNVAGDGLRVAEGSNAKQGTATLAAGTVVVANTSVTANSRILITGQSLGTVTVFSAYGVSARTAGTSFTILASQATDTSVVAYQIFEPG